jgi:hypothetical protein
MNELLQCDGEGRYVRGEKLMFDKQHPRVFAEIVAATKGEFAGQRAMRRQDA